MSPYVNWRQAIKARGARGGVSLLIAALGVALILVVTLASQPGSRLPRYLTFGLKRYANSNESAATRPLGAGSVESGLDCGKGGNPFADKDGIETACIISAIAAAEAGAGSQIRALIAEREPRR